MSLPSAVASSSAFRDQCAVASVDNPRTQFDKVQIQTIELVFGEDNAGRDKLVATAMVQQFEKKTFRSCSPRLELKFKSSKLTASSFIFRR